MKRETLTKTGLAFITLRVPRAFLPLLDRGVRKTDSDRSEFIRAAIREKLARHGVRISGSGEAA